MRELLETEFDGVWRIMTESFPVAEYRPYAAQRSLLLHPAYHIYVKERDGICAFLAVWELDGLDFVEHFAVDSTLRGKGIGSQMLAALRARRGVPVCLEVELPETEIAQRRIAFYQRAGFVCNPYPYEQPPMARGKASVPLMLMSTDRALTQAEFERVRATVYRTVYSVNALE